MLARCWPNARCIAAALLCCACMGSEACIVDRGMPSHALSWSLTRSRTLPNGTRTMHTTHNARSQCTMHAHIARTQVAPSQRQLSHMQQQQQQLLQVRHRRRTGCGTASQPMQQPLAAARRLQQLTVSSRPQACRK